MSKLKRDFGTQYNWFLMNRISTKDKSVGCHMSILRVKPCDKVEVSKPIEQIEKETVLVRPAVRSISTQCCITRTSDSVALPASNCKNIKLLQALPKDINQSKQKVFCLLSCVKKFISANTSYEDLTFELKVCHQKEEFLLVTTKESVGLLGSMTEPVSITIENNGTLSFHTLFKPSETCQILKDQKLDEMLLKMKLDKLSSVGGYVFCSGIIPKGGEELLKPPSLMCLNYPSVRYQSAKCSVYYHMENITKNLRVKQCKECALTSSHWSRARKRKLLETPNRRLKRQRITSNYGLSLLTPNSKKIRISRLRNARKTLASKVAKLENSLKKCDVTLAKDHSEQMEKITQKINEDFPDLLEETLSDEKLPGKTRTALRRAWERDSEIKQNQDKNAFLNDQIKCKTGRKSNKWSAITLRIALAIYCRSNAAYNALRNFEILQLPCDRTLQSMLKKFHHKAGIDQSYFSEQEGRYKKFQEEKIQRGDRKPLGEGVLIFDEVKVIEKVIWNSKSNEFIGFAMDKNDFKDLNDVFEEGKENIPTPTQYVLQFLWRDLTSDFDLIGPYFTSPVSFNQQYIGEALFNTLELLHSYSFSTMALVCDGASENLALIKATIGHRGPFNYEKNETGEIDISINPSFENPFCDGRLLHWVICPSHELKSMVQALFSSKEKGTKRFSRNGRKFGWAEIQGVKRRDEKRAENKLLRHVPKLLTSYVVRDSWTRLNVLPSKIMQQEDVLSELYGFSHSNESTAQKREAAKLAYNYLRACNQLFENGLLSHKRIKATDSEVLDNINRGFKYFENWFMEILEKKPENNFISPQQKHFLSWQTWDLLRITVYGINGLAKDFLKRFPDYFLSPQRINGSAVESLFSQMKFATGSKLSSINFSTSRKAIIARANIHGKNPSNRNYRDTYIYIRDGI